VIWLLLDTTESPADQKTPILPNLVELLYRPRSPGVNVKTSRNSTDSIREYGIFRICEVRFNHLHPKQPWSLWYNPRRALSKKWSYDHHTKLSWRNAPNVCFAIVGRVMRFCQFEIPRIFHVRRKYAVSEKLLDSTVTCAPWQQASRTPASGLLYGFAVTRSQSNSAPQTVPSTFFILSAQSFCVCCDQGTKVHGVRGEWSRLEKLRDTFGAHYFSGSWL